MIVAITGGTGFIGKKLVLRHVKQGDEVRVLSRRKAADSGLPDSVKFWTGDITDYADLHSFVNGVDVLYNCAGEIRKQDRMYSLHVEGTRKLLDAATGRISRWVQLSSVGAYGMQNEGVITEKFNLNPCGTYESTKVQSDSVVMNSALSGAFEYVILRPSNVYGAGMTNTSLYSLISMIRRGLFFFLGKPGASANYIHVDNVVDALMLCGENSDAGGQIFNLSDFRTMEQFVAIIVSVLGRNEPHARLPILPVRIFAQMFSFLPGFPLSISRIDAMTGRAIYSNEKIEKMLSYQHQLNMEAGLQEVVNYWLKKDVV